MKVSHVTITNDTPMKVKLPAPSGKVLVKNFTNGDLKVSIETEDFDENYVTIPPLMAEVVHECETKSSSPMYFFDDVHLLGSASGEVEIRCLNG